MKPITYVTGWGVFKTPVIGGGYPHQTGAPPRIWPEGDFPMRVAD